MAGRCGRDRSVDGDEAAVVIREVEAVDRDLGLCRRPHFHETGTLAVAGGGITVQLAELANSIELRVEDTGLGIPEDQQSKVFERFHRLEGVRGRSREGAGTEDYPRSQGLRWRAPRAGTGLD